MLSPHYQMNQPNKWNTNYPNHKHWNSTCKYEYCVSCSPTRKIHVHLKSRNSLIKWIAFKELKSKRCKCRVEEKENYNKWDHNISFEVHSHTFENNWGNSPKEHESYDDDYWAKSSQENFEKLNWFTKSWEIITLNHAIKRNQHTWTSLYGRKGWENVCDKSRIR